MYFKPVLLLVVVGIVFGGCGADEIARLRKENETLRAQADDQNILRASLHEVNQLLDSIDVNRRNLATEFRRVTSMNDFRSRMKEINQYVKHSEEKLSEIERQLRWSRHEASAYTMLVDALKGEVVIRDGEVVQLNEAVSQFQRANKDLLDSVKYHEAMTTDLHSTISDKQKQLSHLESRVKDLERDFRLTEAEVFYARAKILEEEARRTKLAPQKRRQTFTEALELYRKALSLGKPDAAENIETLEQMLTPSITASRASTTPSLND